MVKEFEKILRSKGEEIPYKSFLVLCDDVGEAIYHWDPVERTITVEELDAAKI